MTARAPANPPSLPVRPASSHAISVSTPLWTIYVGGQTAYDGDVATQTVAAVQAVEAVLVAADTRLDNVASWSVLVVDGHDLDSVQGALAHAWAGRGAMPTLSLARVAGLAHPASLVEISAVAVI